MTVLRSRLRQVRGASLDVSKGRQWRIPLGRSIEPAAPFVRLAPARRLNRIPRLLKHCPELGGDKVHSYETTSSPKVSVSAPVLNGRRAPVAGSYQPISRW